MHRDIKGELQLSSEDALESGRLKRTRATTRGAVPACPALLALSADATLSAGAGALMSSDDEAGACDAAMPKPEQIEADHRSLSLHATHIK